MSEVRLVVRELDRDWSGTIHGSCADRAVAALSADPVTMEDLEAAVARFAKPEPGRRYFGNLSPGWLCDEPHDAGLVVIDLIARLVVVDSSYSSPGHSRFCRTPTHRWPQRSSTRSWTASPKRSTPSRRLVPNWQSSASH